MGKTPEDDQEIFRAEMADDGVVPLKAAARVTLQKARPRPIPFKRIADDLAIPAEMMKDTSGWDADIENGDLITFKRSGLPTDVLRKLKRGQWVVQATLDLHGLTVENARSELGRFLALARHSDVRCVRIVHGKGTRSPNNIAAIRNKVRLSLSRRDEVLAFCDAAPADGGAGAVIVLLKSR